MRTISEKELRHYPIFLISLIFILFSGLYAKGQTDSAAKKTIKRVFGIHTSSTTIGKLEINPDTLQTIDTGLTDVHMYDPILFRTNHYTNLGNNGSPSVPLFFDYPRQTGFNFGLHQWDLYRLTEENMPFYHTRSPYSDFHYAQGPKEFQYFQATHSQNITPYWNASVQYRKLFSQGFYDHQVADDYYAGVNTWYRSKSRRYMLAASAIWNHFSFMENGGLVNDSFFETTNPNSDHIGMPVRFTYANQEWKDQDYKLRQYYYFGTKDVRKIHDSDSVASTLFYPRFFVSHSIGVYNLRYFYKDSLKDTRSFPSYYDSVSTHDQYRFRDISNRISFGQVEYHSPKGERSPFSMLFQGYGQHDLILARHPGKDTSFQNIMAGGGLNISTFFRLHGEANYVLYGYNRNDYSLTANIEFPFSILKYRNTLGFSGRNQQSEPAFLDQTLYSNHFTWENNFRKTKYYELQGFLYSDTFHYRLSARYNAVSSLIYYGYDAEPEQAATDFQYFMIEAEKDFSLGRHFHLNNSLIYQKALQGDFVRFPDFSFRGSYFYETAMFKNALLAQFGFDFRYNSTYEAYAYTPSLSQFYLQNQIKIGNYPYFDAWVSARISRFRIFFKCEHLTQGLFGYHYYATPHYPFYPRTVLRLGLRWMFYN